MVIWTFFGIVFLELGWKLTFSGPVATAEFYKFPAFYFYPVKCEICSVVSNSLQPHELYSPWNSLDQNTGVGSLFLL